MANPYSGSLENQRHVAALAEALARAGFEPKELWHRAERNAMKHIVVPALGLVANIAMLGAIVLLSLSSGGSTQTDTLIALAAVGFWIVLGAIWLGANSRATNRGILVRPAVGGASDA